MSNTLINYISVQTLKPNWKLKIEVNRSKTCHYILYLIVINQIRVNKQLYHRHRTIHYQITPAEPTKPNIDASTQQSDTSPCIARDKPKRNRRPSTYLKDYVT